MNIFELRQQLIDDFAGYVKSFITIRDHQISNYVERELFQDGVLWPEPLIQLNPRFASGKSIDALVDEKILHPHCAHIFRGGKSEQQPRGELLNLYRHQEEAIRIAREGHSYVLTTGTGSGKSLAYMVPIVDYVLRNPERQGVKAIVVYPMNALANSQKIELEKYLDLCPAAIRERVRFARYTGQENEDERKAIIDNPPDILLTNYVMLELLLTRPRERTLMETTRLRFLVLDELHTYRGRQGADVALLVRRVRDRLTPPEEHLQCVGTSATLAGEGSYAEQQRDVAEMATRIFGDIVAPEHVIGETLKRVTEEVDEVGEEFRRQLTQRVRGNIALPESYQEFVRDPLAIWLESIFGIIKQGERWIRTTPRRIAGEKESAAARLEALSGIPAKQCAEAIRNGLLAGNERVKHPETGRAPFAFRLHQFISKGDMVYATLDIDEQRHLTLQRQQYKPGDRSRILLPLVFCRECGQEYYCVRWQDEYSFTWRKLNEQGQEDENKRGKQDGEDKHKGKKRSGIAGFLYVSKDAAWPKEIEAIDALLPGDWTEEYKGKTRILPGYRDYRPKPLRVNTQGYVVGADEEGVDCHFVPAPFRMCLNQECNVVHSSSLRSDFGKLTTLSSEGRSTATTILSLSAIRHLKEARVRGDEGSIKPKMLSFTDNRQDASLQAGHFNDFVEIALLRSALYRAVKVAGDAGLEHDRLPLEVFAALNLAPKDYASNQELKYSMKAKTEKAFRNVLGYRLYLDLQRGWRVTSPNLEQCGLLRIEYQDLAEICEDEELWQEGCHDALKHATPAIRQEVVKALLDHMRRELAIKVDYLSPTFQEEIKLQSSQHLLAPWALDENESDNMTYATTIFPRRRPENADRSYLYLSGRSNFGQYVRRKLKAAKEGERLRPEDAQLIIQQLLEKLSDAGPVEKVVEAEKSNKVAGYQLAAAAILWQPGDGSSAYHDPLRMRQQPVHQERYTNAFFRAFYQTNADSLVEMEAREHTAQVPVDLRQDREDRFREVKQPILPILYCSPTMELGVDIAELNVVNMRNIPPTPANYAQRSGRAGRSGQPALVFSYCSTGSSHDQYFFCHPEDMVRGAVTPPRLDLTNEDLIRAHVHAIWLAETGLSLEKSLKDLLDVEGTKPTLKLLDEVERYIHDEEARRRAETRARRVLETLGEARNTPWYADNWLSDILRHVGERFDQTCKRWRELYRAAQEQFVLQNEVILDASRSAKDRQIAERLRAEAQSQLGLLTNVEKLEQSEFYSYRYFASEGFLPGYNFPRLPLSAYIPARRLKQRDEYLSRPRFLAIAEFAPGAIIYHEGSRYMINRSVLGVRDGGVLTQSIKQCEHCGYLHQVGHGVHLNICEQCHKQLRQQLNGLFKLQNVSTRRRDKINSDEEERLRQGYNIRTAVQFVGKEKQSSSITADVRREGELYARLTYGHAAKLWRINFGPLRRRDKSVQGFLLDTETGFWETRENSAASDPGTAHTELKTRVIPYVEDWRNCLIYNPLKHLTEDEMVSLQAALKSAIQVKYQLEDNELAAEPLPASHNRRYILFYEAAEGGAGVLRQLIDDPLALAAVAREALELCHFDPVSFQDQGGAERALEKCEAACYNCLMTYANQRDHRLLDRKSIAGTLQALTTGRVEIHEADEKTLALEELSELEREWLAWLEEQECEPPKSMHQAVDGYEARPDFLYEHVAIYVDGALAEYPERYERDKAAQDDLIDIGYRIIRFQERESWSKEIERNPRIFGRRKG